MESFRAMDLVQAVPIPAQPITTPRETLHPQKERCINCHEANKKFNLTRSMQSGARTAKRIKELRNMKCKIAES